MLTNGLNGGGLEGYQAGIAGTGPTLGPEAADAKTASVPEHYSEVEELE